MLGPSLHMKKIESTPLGVHGVCFHDQKWTEWRLNVCSRRYPQDKYIGRIRGNFN